MRLVIPAAKKENFIQPPFLSQVRLKSRKHYATIFPAILSTEKKPMRAAFVLFILIASVIFACTKKNYRIGDNEYVTLTYKQTFCADPWATGANDSLTLVNVAAYLNSSSLYIAGLNIKQDGSPDMCLACACKTGKTITVSTLNSETLKAKYMQIGFK